MFTKKPTNQALALALAIPAGLSFQTSAQEEFALEEIVVTAQKREQKLSDVPLAVSVLGSDQIDASFSNNLESLQALVPSVSIRTGNTTRNSALTVRGIGTISFSIGAEPSVSTVVDNVVLGRSGQAFGDLYDLERIEVLRGPQGTLFGKNASAGVVNMVTKRPTEEFEGYVDLSLFQDGESKIKTRVAGALTDSINASVTMMDAEFDGFIKNVYNNEKVNGYDKQGLRAMFDMDLGNDTTALIIYEDYDADNDCCTDLVARNTNASRPLDSEVFVSGGNLNLDQRKVDHDFETRTQDSTTAFSVQFEKGFGDYTLTSITARRTWNNTEFREGDFTSTNGDSTDPVNFSTVGFQLHDVGPQEWRQLSQEIRLSSPGGETFDWQVGGFYWEIDSARSFTREASCQVTGDNTAIVNAADLADPTLGLTCLQNDIVSATAFMNTEFTNFAVFGDGSYALSDTLSVLFGLRYTDDEVSFKHNRRNNDEYGRRGVGVRQATLNTDFADTTSDTNLSGKLGLQLDVGEESMVYATYATGYKGPAFNVFYNMSENDINPINSEESESFEVGYKYTGSRLFLSTVYYNTEIENFQANDFDVSDGVTTTGFTNGGDVETEGVEVDLLWQATEFLKVSGGLASSKAETTTGAELPFAPDLKYSVTGEYSIPTDNGGEWVINASYVHTDDRLSGNIGQDEVSNPEVFLPEYDILNASLTYRSPEEKYTVSLVGKNLTDESYATTYSGDGFRYQIPRDAERYFGANFRYNF